MKLEADLVAVRLERSDRFEGGRDGAEVGDDPGALTFSVAVDDAELALSLLKQTAAAAARLGLRCELLFENRIQDPDSDYLNSGNVFLDRMFDATIQHHPKGADMNAAMEARARDLEAEGRRCYIIPGGGSNRVGALGYVDCASELTGQITKQGVQVNKIVHATGSAGTQAGLAAGLEALNSTIDCIGVSVRDDEATQVKKVHALAEETARTLGEPTEHDPADLTVARNWAAREDILPIGLLYRNPEAVRYDRFTLQGVGLPAADRLRAVQQQLDRFRIGS